MADQEEKMLNKFSRQNAAFGAEVTMKLTKMKALVVGCNGTGVEVVKNLILQGLGGVTLCDQRPAEMKDLGMNFFLSESDVGKSLGPTLVPKFQELNPFCNIKALESPLSGDDVTQHTVMIICDHMPLPELLKWSDFCRTGVSGRNIPFIYAHTGGVFSSVFVDFGPNHIVTDSDGANPLVRLVDSIETGTDTLVRISVPDGQAPGSLPENCFVEFSDVKGCDGIDSHQEPGPTGDMVTAWKISSKPNDPANSFRIGDTSSLRAYVSGGLVTEKKVPKPMPFKSLPEALKNPGFPFDSMVGTDLINFGSELQTHVAFHAVLAAEAERGAPLTGAEADVAAVVSKAKELMTSGSSEVEIEVDEAMFTKYVRHFRHPLQPLCAFLGGVVAQEVVKCAGKYTPIPGFFHFNALEALPDELPADCAPKGSRYDLLAAVYGHAFVEKLGNLRYFMVGCGALGCEYLKNFALNGVCCGETGGLMVTDNDRIELSNLTRQFLFREHNVGHSKSTAASEMAKIMNPSMKLDPQELLVCAKSEDFFNDKFWTELDGVCNALDNMEARFYVDAQCVKYSKPLLESGTMGPAGNIDPVVPFKTQTYRDGGQAAEDGGIPMCTLRNFPHLPDHCIEWARDQFELLFVKSLKILQKFNESPMGFIKEKASTSDVAQTIFEVRAMKSLLTAMTNKSLSSCAQLSFDYFHFLFRDKILDLTAAFPEDARITDPETKQDKGAFWSGHKRFPRAAVFDVTNEAHWRYHVAATSLFAFMLGVVPEKDPNDEGYLKEFRSQQWAAESVKDLTIPEHIPAGVNMEGDDNAANAGSQAGSSKDVLEKLLKPLESFCGSNLADLDKATTCLKEADFEKDDDFNFHIDFITQVTNIRADNYFIQNSDFQKVKLVAGRIIPAVATTTAAVCGLTMLELFKVVLGKKADDLRTRQIGLAVNTFTSFSPNEPNRFSSGTEEKKPNVSDLPSDAFDAEGQIKAEFIEKESYAAYPEKHSIWDKLVVPSGTVTLEGFQKWLLDDHKLKLKSWNFVLGWKRVEDENGKEMKVPYSAPIFPPPVAVDPALMPPLTETVASAMQAIMRNTAIPQNLKMKYHGEWKIAQSTGQLPKADAEVVKKDMSLKEILKLMEKKAEAASQDGTLHAKWGRNISGLDSRHFWVIPSDQTPSCTTTSDDASVEPLDVRYLAAIQIPLVA